MTFRTITGTVTLIAAVTLVSSAWAQTADKKEQAPQTPPIHLEVPRDKYVPVPPERRATTPAVRQVRDGYVSVQVNVDENGDNIVNDAANEPSIAVDPTNPNRIVIGWRQFDTVYSDFRQAGWGYSHDGGRSWTFPGVIEPGVFRSDPVLGVDVQGNFYFNSLTAEGYDFWCHVFRSTDSGVSWDAGTYAYGGDKQWMTIDRTDGIGQGNIYAFWTQSWSICYPGHFTRSYDGGQTFTSCIQVPGSPYWGTLAVGPDGELYVVGDGFVVAKSSTMQDESLPAQWDFSTTVYLDGSMVGWGGPNPEGLCGQAWVAVDHSNGPSRGNVYLLCSVARYSTTDPQDIMFARSTNGGLTWSDPVRVNDDPVNNGAWQWFGTMSVAPNGRIDATWNDTRNDPGGYDSELYYAYSEDGGQTWSPNVALSPPFDPHVGWPQQNKLGDYNDMVSDDMGVDVAYAATFNGEQDVYYLRIGQRCSDAGTITLDRPKYACESTAGLTVNDCGLNLDDATIDTVDISIASDSEPAGETITLYETDVATSLFEGSITLSQTDAAGILLVAEGDTVTAIYIDADDGEGHYNVEVTDTATVDCTPPSISNVQTINIEPRRATVTFDADEPARGTVYYGLSCDSLTWTAVGSGYATSPTVALTGLSDNTTYFYAVEAEDEAGNPSYDDNSGNCYTFNTPDIPDFFTESFESGGNDLDNLSLIFTPSGSYDFYAGCVEEITELPTDPSGGTTIYLSDDDYEHINLAGGETVSLYGAEYSGFYVGSNGYITFTAGDTAYNESLEGHFNQPRISALFDDLTPSSGTVSWKQLADRAVVTWQNVPEYGTSNSNTFQIEMYFNGDIHINYLSIAASDGLAGLSAGGGVDPDFYPSDLSAMGSCGPRPPQAENSTVSTAANTPVDVTLVATDDGLPDPPAALTYIIASLPTHGTLSDPGAGVIESTPYTLADGGNQVVYTPDTWYLGGDSFTFMANDGGEPPEGGDSNIATVEIDVTPPDSQLIYEFPLDSDPGWTAEGLWAFGQPTGGGTHNRDPSSGYTGANVYGYNLYGDYSNNMPAYYLTTSAIDCRDLLLVELRFWRWLGVERSPFDNATVEVSTDGSNWSGVWSNPDSTISDSSWTPMTLDISAVADDQPTVYLRWDMGPTDEGVTYPGWNIDDVEIWAVDAGPPCPGDLDGDNDVDLSDLSILLANYGMTGGAEYEDGDLDGDGDVDLSDLSALLAHYGETCP
jgi:hypothetical protein